MRSPGRRALHHQRIFFPIALLRRGWPPAGGRFVWLSRSGFFLRRHACPQERDFGRGRNPGCSRSAGFLSGAFHRVRRVYAGRHRKHAQVGLCFLRSKFQLPQAHQQISRDDRPDYRLPLGRCKQGFFETLCGGGRVRRGSGTVALRDAAAQDCTSILRVAMPYEFKHTKRVEFSDTDMAGIMHFSNFFRFMEATETAFLRERGLSVSWHEGGVKWGFPRRAVSCDYQKPAKFQDLLTVAVTLEKLGTKSVTYRFDFTNEQ